VVVIEENVFSAVNRHGDDADAIVGNGMTHTTYGRPFITSGGPIRERRRVDPARTSMKKQREVFELGGVKPVISRLFLLPGAVQ
jgi:hypothetical protein